MSEQKHFSYEGTLTLSEPKKVTIKDVVFLTPARVKLDIDGREQEKVVSVDIINKKVYDENGLSKLTDSFFQYLDDLNSLPEDFFEASPEIYEQVTEAEKQRALINADYLGGLHERNE